MTAPTLERKMTEARIRYQSSMSFSAHIDPTVLNSAQPSRQSAGGSNNVTVNQRAVHERRGLKTRQSFCVGTSSRIDPSSFIRSGETVAPSAARQQFHKTNFDGLLSVKEESSARPRHVSLIEPPGSVAKSEKTLGRRISMRASTVLRQSDATQTEDGSIGTSFVTPVSRRLGSSLMSATPASRAVIHNDSSALAAVITPKPANPSTGSIARSQGADLSVLSTTPSVKTSVKCNVVAREANNMEHCNLVPQRKQSRWSRKKSIEAGKTAFALMCSPKKYGFQAPPRQAAPTAGHGVFKPTTRAHFEMVCSPLQAVRPPWATDA